MAALAKAKQLRDDTFTSALIQAKFASGAFNLTVVNDVFAASSIADDRLVEDYILANGTRAFTAAQSMGGFKLTNVADGTTATDAVNYGQLQAVVAGLDPKGSVRLATVGLLSAISTAPVYNPTGGTSARGQITFTTGPTAVDGVNVVNGDRILVKNESDGTAEVHSVDTVADVAGSLNSTFFVFYTTPNRGFYVWFNVSGGGVDPAPAAPAGVTFQGIMVAIATNDTATAVAIATKAAIDATSFVNKGGQPTVGQVANALTITNAEGGNVTNVADGSAATGFTFGTDTQGTGLGGAANGIWVRTGANTWDRATDFDTDAEVTAGVYFPTEEGTVNEDQLWLLITNNPITVGGAAGTPLTFQTFGSLNLGGTPSTITPDAVAAEGTSFTAARSDHVHAIAAAAPGSIQPDDTADEGVSTSFSRADHRHAIATDVAVSVTIANAEGASTSFARADHTHNSPKFTKADKGQNPTATTGNEQTTGVTLASEPALDTYPLVFINTLGPYEVGDGVKTKDCYFSGDGGTTARAIGAIASGDQLIWNGTIAGFDLETDDVIDFEYLSFATN